MREYFVIKTKICFAVTLICCLCSCQSKVEAITTATIPTFNEVTYQSEGTTISGGLWLPEKKGPHPAMVIVHGSGRATKNAAHYMALHFVEMGFAVLSHDKRGVGKSEGTYVGRFNTSKENLELLAKDVSAGVEFLKTRSDIDTNQIGLYGWSQAGWITPIVASMQEGLKFSILISGPTVTVGEENYYSQLTGDGSVNPGLSREEMSRKLKERGPYGVDPMPLLKKMNMPGLWLLGDADQSIPIPETVANLDKLINEDNRNFTYHVFDRANHGLRVNGVMVKDYWKLQDNFLLEVVKINVP
ncbi:MAG: prolyl oligopeptidase family serine peptidase [Reichenbachiella sp.]|uniref:alpha/beta hydrolase family protein n=1 Tax=Reichenbachiella sp. TaxID=2184521 RepID=UPI00326488B9